MNFPVYEMMISDDDETGVDYIALVDNPAIEKTFQAFSDQRLCFKVMDTSKHVISGPLMIANLPIYRNNEARGEHYVVFTPATIEKIVHKYFREKNTGNVNVMHEKKIAGVHLFESYIVDNAIGKTAPAGFPQLTDGSWFGSFKVDNQDIWDNFIKTGIFKGFSVEGIFMYVNGREVDEESIETIREAIHMVDKMTEILSLT